MIESDTLTPVFRPIVERTITRNVDSHVLGKQGEWDLKAIVTFAEATITKPGEITIESLQGLQPDEMVAKMMEFVDKEIDKKRSELHDDAQMLQFEKSILLRVIDSHWMNHLDAMDQFRQSVGLRGYGSLDPLNEYQTNGFAMFEEMIAGIEHDATRLLMKSEIRQNLS